jgi:Carboxypeptidase regulatory-like domain
MSRSSCSTSSWRTGHAPILSLYPVMLCLCLGLAPRLLIAQTQATTGVIRGTVRDPAGSPIANVTVSARNVGTNFTRAVITNGEGAYAIPLLPLGSYEVTARVLGYGPARQTGVSVRLGATAEVSFTLVRQAVALAAVQITGAREAIDPAQSAAATELDARVVEGLPNNGRNFLGLVLLTPNTAVVQGPDGDELSIAGQRGIHNNISVDGADFNNPFFGEQRGGQRPAFTFNLDAVQDMVVIASGANAEFGRSGGGFVNVVTRSGTNTVAGTAHYYGKSQALASSYSRGGGKPDFSQQQFGFTVGGPIAKDRLFYFVAYDQQLFNQTKQTLAGRIASQPLRQWMDTAFGGALAGDYGPVRRTNDANALLIKLDAPLGTRHNASLKYNYTNSRQENGTFDVDPWARSANATEMDYSHALNGFLASSFSADVTNEFRFQIAREYRPRTYGGPTNPGTGRPFPDTGMDFANGYRLGMPFFIPVQSHDDRIQVLDNVSLTRGAHLFKFGGEWNRTAELQTFVGFGNGRMIFGSVNGFLNYNAFGNTYVECSNGTSSVTGACPAGSTITGPVILYLQQAGIGGRTVEDAGTQSIPQHEVALFAQDSWKATSRLTVNYGLRWEAQIEPDVLTPPDQVFYAPFIGQTRNGQLFPSNGKIPSDWKMFQPRLGMAWDIDGDGRSLLRASAGVFYARVPGLVLAGTRNTNGSIGQTLFRSSAASPFLGPPPKYGELLPIPAGGPFQPSVTVFDQNFQNPRTISGTIGYEHALAGSHVAAISYTAAATDYLTRFVDRNDPVFGSPWATGLSTTQPGNGLGTLTTVESSAKSRYQGVTLALRQTVDPQFQYEVNYTLSYDRSDDDNERDPFSFRYAKANNLAPEYGYSDRDQRHRFNAWALAQLPWRLSLNNKVSAQSAQPRSAKCGANNLPTDTTAATGADRICPNGTILQRNTLRKDNAFFTWDMRLTRPFEAGKGRLEAVLEVFNITNADNFKDPSSGGLLFNFDGTVRSGLGDPRQAQLGLRYLF